MSARMGMLSSAPRPPPTHTHTPAGTKLMTTSGIIPLQRDWGGRVVMLLWWVWCRGIFLWFSCVSTANVLVFMLVCLFVCVAGVLMTSGAAAAAFTSTDMPVHTHAEAAPETPADVMKARCVWFCRYMCV